MLLARTSKCTFTENQHHSQLEEILLKAKFGRPHTTAKGGDIIAKRELENASIVKRSVGGNRRITSKQSMTQITISRKIKAALKLAKGKTKAAGRDILKQAVDGLMHQANEMGAQLAEKHMKGIMNLTQSWATIQDVQTRKDEEQKALADKIFAHIDALRRSGRSAVASSGERTDS